MPDFNITLNNREVTGWEDDCDAIKPASELNAALEVHLTPSAIMLLGVLSGPNAPVSRRAVQKITGGKDALDTLVRKRLVDESGFSIAINDKGRDVLECIRRKYR